jgi:hypothetical protein
MASVEDVVARVPLIGPLSGAETDEQKALVRQQKRMAEDAKRRAELVGPARMRAMNQQVLAFGPRNKMADMTANPMPAPGDPAAAKLDAELRKYGLDSYEKVLAYNKQAGHQITDNKGFMAAMKHREEQAKLEAAEKQRRAALDQAFATGPGPAPIAPMQAAPVRRY